MADVKWIKIVTDIFDDEKILLIESMPEADSVIVCWFKLLCLAGKQNNSGVFTMNNRIAYTDEMLATIFRRPLNTVRLAMNTFEQFGMIEIINGVITIPNWEKHQNIDGLDKIREQNRLRKQKEREKTKMLSENTVMSRDSHVTSHDTVTQCHATDKNRLEEIRLEEKREENNNTSVYLSGADYSNYFEGLEGQERAQKAMEYAKLARVFHQDGNEATAKRFADIAEFGGLPLNRETYLFE